VFGAVAFALLFAVEPPAKPGDPAGATAPETAVPVRIAPETPSARTLGLRRERDGSFEYVDPHKRFRARIASDGSVQFADRWRRPHPKNPSKGRCCALPPGASGMNPIVGMTFSGPLEWLIAAQGKDVLARDKAEWMAATREVRTQMAIDFTKQTIAARLSELEDDLAAIWSSDESVGRKRELLFQRWDECDELVAVAPEGVPAEAISEIDGVRIDAAAKARRRIEAFVRKHAPAGEAAAFAAEELREFNARRVSREPFAPYDERRQKAEP
jgi:hypothetical protein